MHLLTAPKGNNLADNFFQGRCNNLHYLELAGCRLKSLPSNIPSTLPNIRVLNLNYNFLEDISSLGVLPRLRKLTLIGSRLSKTKPLIGVAQNMPNLEMLDFRYVVCLVLVI